jgi:hypothetical protein
MADDFPLGQVQQLHPHRSGADIHGQGVMPAGGVSGFDVHETGIAGPPLGEIQGGGHLEILLAHGFGQLAGQQEIQGQVFETILFVQTLFQAGQVANVVA